MSTNDCCRTTRFALSLGSVLAVVLSTTADLTRAADIDGRADTWRGYPRVHFKVAGQPAYVVKPKAEANGRPWVWRARFPDYHAEMDVALLGKGFHIAYVNVAGLFGSPKAMARGDALYKFLTEKHGFAKKPALEGVSRGGLFVYNWAARHPDKIACIYADTPVLDFKSWPGGKGNGRGHGPSWRQCIKAYGLTEDEAINYKYNPIDNLKPIADARVPLMHVVSENDVIVPPKENTHILVERYRKLGGKIEIITVQEGTAKSGGHHFTHPQPKRVVDFIVKHASVSGEKK